MFHAGAFSLAEKLGKHPDVVTVGAHGGRGRDQRPIRYGGSSTGTQGWPRPTACRNLSAVLKGSQGPGAVRAESIYVCWFAPLCSPGKRQSRYVGAEALTLSPTSFVPSGRLYQLPVLG